MSSWNNLSMKERADVMKLFIDKDIYNLDTIREEYNRFADGGGIHIKDSKKGTFTAAASRHNMGVQEFASKVLANKDDYSSAMVKKANFAKNASRWKHGLGGNLFENGGPKRRRPMPMHPSKRETDPVAYSAYQEWLSEEASREQLKQKQAEDYAKRRDERNARAAEKFNRDKGVVMSALSDIADSVPFTGSEIRDAAESQRQEKLDKWHEIRNGIDASATAAEMMAAGYGILRGLTHLKRYGAQKAFQNAGMNLTSREIQNLSKWDRRVAKIDKPQVLMNGVGGSADGYQWITADNSFDAWENGLETGANAAGVVGGMNWFRNLPALRRIGGDKIDAVLDGLGYGAAAWDVVKNLPPLSGALEGIRQQSKGRKPTEAH
jgi:hypothetical protein